MNTIREVLKTKGMSQIELSERLGMKPQYLNRLVKGHVTPGVFLAIKIAQELDLKVEDVFSPVESKFK